MSPQQGEWEGGAVPGPSSRWPFPLVYALINGPFSVGGPELRVEPESLWALAPLEPV